MNLLNEPVLFSAENVEKIENLKNAKYVIDTEKNDVHVAIFYGSTAPPVSGSRYFGLYYGGYDNRLMITDGSFVEEQEIIGVVAENGDVIFSRYRHDYRTSPDGTATVDGGRAYVKSSLSPRVRVRVKDGNVYVEELDIDN